MGYSQGKMIKPDEIQNQSIISKDSANGKLIFPINENYKIISKTTKKNVDCKIIEFINNENKQVDCEISLNRINFEEAYEMDFIFDSVIKTFENMGINLPLVIFLNIENARINIFLKLKSVDEIIVITNKFISLIKNFNKLMKFTNDIDYKVHKKPEIQSNYSPLNGNNSYINCFSNPSKAVNVNSCFNNNNVESFNAKEIKVSEKDYLNVAGNAEVSSKIEFIEFMSMNNIYKNCYQNTKLNKNSNLIDRKRMLTFDNNNNNNYSNDLEKNAFEIKDSSTKITNETLAANNNKNNVKEENPEEETSLLKESEKAPELEARESSNKKLRIHTESEENQLENPAIKEKMFYSEKNKNKNEAFETKERTLEISHEELERMYFIDQNKETFENRDLLNQQPKEEIEKLFNELLVNKQTAASTGNLLLNENFLNSENTINNRLSFDEAENDQSNNIPVDSNPNFFIERTLKNKKVCDVSCNNNDNNNDFEKNANIVPSVGKFGKNIKFTFDEAGFENAYEAVIENDNKKNNGFELKEKEKRLNEIQQNKRLPAQKKEIKINQDFEKDLNQKQNLSSTNEIYKRNTNDFNNDLSKANSNFNNFPNCNSKNRKKFSFPTQQEPASYQNNINFNNNSLEKTFDYNNDNYFDNMDGIKNKNTRNYYINNILNFNPNSNFSENPKMQNISNINAMMNPSLINHNMLMMMKKFNQNSQMNNQIINNNLFLNQTNNFTNQNHINQVNNNTNNILNFNHNNAALKGNINNNQCSDLNNKNYFINNNLHISNNENNYDLSKNGFEVFNNKSFKASKDLDENLAYLEDKVKLISLEDDSLEGFYFKRSDYISDEDFISFYFIGNLTSLAENNNKINSSTQSESEIKENYAFILFKYFKENFNLKLKQIIQNPSESESISRLIFHKNNSNNFNNENQILKETDGLEHNKINILNSCFILIRIKSLVLKLHPEELFLDLQLKVNYEINNFDERDFVNFLENNLQIDFFEISFISEGECILTFYEREALKQFMSLLQQKPFHQIKRPLKKVKIEASFLTEPFQMQGKKINIFNDEEDNENESSAEKALLPLRPPACIKVLTGNYTPSLRNLICFNEDLWSNYKIEKNNFDLVSVEQFASELGNLDFDKIKEDYAAAAAEDVNYCGKEKVFKGVVFTIVDYAKKPKKAKMQLMKKIINDDFEEEAEREEYATLCESNKMNFDAFKQQQRNKNYLKNKVSKDKLDSSEVEFSSGEKSETSFSLRNLEASDLDLDETNPFSKALSRKKDEVKVYKKRGRKPKSELLTNVEENQINSNSKNILHRNDYGKKFIKNNNINNNYNSRRSYNHSRYTVNNLQLESSIDPTKPNILDELIENDLNAKEKLMLEKIEKEVEERIFKKNTNLIDFLPRKRGRRPKADYADNSSENVDYFRKENSKKVLLRDKSNKNDFNENYEEADKDETKIFKNNINVNIKNEKSEREYDYKIGLGKVQVKSISYETENDFNNKEKADETLNVDGKEANEVDNGMENLKKKCLDEDVINKILSRKDDSKFDEGI